MEATQLKLAADTEEQEHAHEHSLAQSDFVGIVFLAFAVFLYWVRIPYADLLAIVATFVGGYPIFKEAFSNLRERRMTMELSMSIALFAALAIAENFTALLITLFVLIAEALEN